MIVRDKDTEGLGAWEAVHESPLRTIVEMGFYSEGSSNPLEGSEHLFSPLL